MPKSVGMQTAVKLVYKYKCRSISELYDKCTSEEFAELIYSSYNNNYQHYLCNALHLFIKDSLDLQRRDRWEYMMSHAKFNAEEEHELLRLFSVQGIDPKIFCSSLKEILMCSHPKRNTFKIWGTSGSGKTLIAQLIGSIFITCYSNNHCSESEFFLSNMLNKSLVLCEELYVTRATCEDFKSILGGALIDISRKHTEKQILSRTPVIITSQYQSFGRGFLSAEDESALKSRCHVFEFKQPFTPDCHISPSSLFHFLFLAENQNLL